MCTWPSHLQFNEVVISQISLPNGQSYHFFYGSDNPDPNFQNPYGSLSEIDYPSGGSVKYTWKLSDNLNELAVYTGGEPDGETFNGVRPVRDGCIYQYQTPVVASRQVFYGGSTSPAETQTFLYHTNWNSNGAAWTTKTTQLTSTDNVRSLSALTAYTYSFYLQPIQPFQDTNYPAQIPQESSIAYYNWGNTTTPLRTVSKIWADPFDLLSQTTTLVDVSPNLTSKVSYCYVGSNCIPGALSQLQEVDDYDYGANAPGALLRKTVTNYQSFPALPNGGVISDLPSSTTVYDGNSNIASETDFYYDENSVAGVSSLPSGTHDEANFGAGFSYPRGNATTVTRQCFNGPCAGGNSTATFTYDETGQLLTKTDACGNAICSDMSGSSHTTTYSYADSYTVLSSGQNVSYTPSANPDAYLTKITDALGHTENFTYDFNTAERTASKDQNNQSTTYLYNDPFNRPTLAVYPDGGLTTISYNDAPFNSSAPSPSVRTTKAMTSSTNLTTLAAFDGLGHSVRAVLNSDPDGASGDRTDTTYDGIGRVFTVSNPYCTTSDPIYGLTTYVYDALGRTTQVKHADNSTVLTSYSGRATQVQDEGNGTQRVTRISQTDALGRLSSICEVASAPFVGTGGSSSSSLIGQNGSSAACGQDIAANGFVTSYGYDVLDNLIGVAQGSVARSFNYDSLSRLTSAANPESGTITYVYDANGNTSSKTAPAPNQTGTATVTTSYQYDALNRLTQKSYSDGTTPTASYYYDSYPNFNATNPIGRFLVSSVPSQLGLCCIATLQEYDPMGRISEQSQYLPTGCACDYALPYTYDLMGNMLTSTDPYGNSFTYGYNGAGRITSVTGSYSDANDPASLLSAMHYNAAGQPISDQLGDDGEVETYTYTNRNQLRAMSAVNGSTPIYNYSLTFAPNGNVLTANDSVNGNWNYSYDQFNRLVCANLASNGTCATPPTGTPTYTYVYDRFGNRWQQNGSYSMQLSFTGSGSTNNNRMDGHSYDSAGNLLNDGTHQYFYDAESHLIQVDGTAGTCTSGSTTGTTACYYYDAEGRRVWRTGFTADSCDNTGKRGYVFDVAGHVIVENNSNGTGCQGQVYVGERHFGRQGGGTFFYHADWLGTVRFINSDGYPTQGAETCTSLPFGDGLSCNSNYGNVWHFTGKERDYESGLDNFGARYDASSMGRFMSPDDFWKDSHVGDPQSWNKYAYARNNPLRYVDLNGENATVSTSCTTDDQKHTTCNVNVSASIAIYATPGSGLTQEQVSGAATTIQNEIQNAWSGSFTADGVTYNVSTQVSVSVAGSEADAMGSGAQNVIGLSNGRAGEGGDSLTAAHSISGGPDTGVWNYNNLDYSSGHEFGHLIGQNDTDYGFTIMNHTGHPTRATTADLSDALGGVVNSWTGNYDTAAGDTGGIVQRGGKPIMAPGSPAQVIHAPYIYWHWHNNHWYQ